MEQGGSANGLGMDRRAPMLEMHYRYDASSYDARLQEE
jgi:hypothetical protein